MRAILAVHREFHIINDALAVVSLAFSGPGKSAVRIHILHLSFAGLTFDQVVVLDVLGLLCKDKIVIDRCLHHVLVDLLRVDLVIALRVKGHSLGAFLIKME